MSRPFQVGDVVFAEGASALLGDVTEVVEADFDYQHVTVRWRETTTTEDSDDLNLADDQSSRGRGL